MSIMTAIQLLAKADLAHNPKVQESHLIAAHELIEIKISELESIKYELSPEHKAIMSHASGCGNGECE